MGKMKKLKMTIISGLIIVIVLAMGFFILSRGSSNDELTAYVDSVSMITGLGSGSGLVNRYSGIVEPQETIQINRNEERKIKELYVKVGDKVEEGTELFAYDTDEMNLKLSQAELELERLKASITSLKEQIKLLNSQKDSVSADEKLEYTSQILNAESELKRAEYDVKSKQVEIDQLKLSLENSVVKSSVAGVVKSISETGMDMYGQSEAYMTLLSTKDYRVKGKVSEQSVWLLQTEQPVIIRSRVDETQTWNGIITSVDLESTESSNNNNYYEQNTESATTYPFYIELQSAVGLILGQHVYIELDYGQDEVKDGVWLYDYYLVHEGDQAYVWVATEDNKLEKREVQLGDFDEEWMRYEIIDGLTLEDYIAFPDERLSEGMPCERFEGSGGYLPMDDLEIEENLEGTFEENFGEVTEEGRVELEEIIDEPSSDSIHDDSDQSSEDVIVQ